MDQTELSYEVLPDDYTQYDLSFKLIVIGDSGVGKSCLTQKATKNVFESNYSATVGFEFFTFNVRINDKVIKLQIWDTCGQEIYRSLITNFYRNSSLAIMVYAIDNQESFENIDTWLKEIKTHSNPDVKVFLIGNKNDLTEHRKVGKELGEKLKNDCNLDFFAEASAKSGFNAKNVFVESAKVLYRDYLNYKERLDKTRSPSDLSTGGQKQNTKLDRNAGKSVNDPSSINTKKSGCC